MSSKRAGDTSQKAWDMGKGLGLDRRSFLSGCAGGLCAFAASSVSGPVFGAVGTDGPPRADEAPLLTEARHYEKLADRAVRCKLCPRECEVADLERGYCGVRENRGGTYYTLVHSRPCTWHVDPIEKKPFYHVLPGTNAYSIATVGCNVECKFCQNWQISQVRPEQIPAFDLPPKALARYANASDARSVAYTYTEPVIYYEYVRDGAEEVRKRGLRNLMVSGGYVQEDPLRELVPLLDAVKIDLKAFSETFYADVCSGELKPVLRTLERLVELGVWTEIVYLMVPTLNDDETELTDMCRWIAAALGKDIPVHFTRFHPAYRLRNLPPTPVQSLERAVEIARAEGLRFAYIGNVPGHPAENTTCPGCGSVLIERRGYSVRADGMKEGSCAACDLKIPGIWQ